MGKDTPEDTSLVDRATMGRYPPGSIMKIMTAAAAVEEGIDIKYTCTGEDIIEGQRVTCAGGTAHGELTLESAFTKSCNTYFANLAVKIGGQRLLQEASKFGFNKEWNFSDINLYPVSYTHLKAGTLAKRRSAGKADAVQKAPGRDKAGSRRRCRCVIV